MSIYLGDNNITGGFTTAEKNQFNNSINLINEQLDNITYNANYEMPCGEFVLPSDMPCKLPFKIRKDIDGTIRHTADFSKFKIGGISYFVDVDNGNDSNDGYSIETAFKTLGKAIETIKNTSYTGLFKVYLEGFVEGGDGMKYCTSDIWEIGSNKDISIIAYSPNATISTGYKKEKYYGCWEDYENIKFLNVLDEEFTAVYDTRNLDAYEQYTALKRVKTLEECKNTKDTFYSIPILKGGGLYVNSDSAVRTNLLNGYTCIVGQYLTDTGELASSSYNPATSQFMEVMGGNSYELINAHSPGNNVCWYDENKAFISAVKISDSSQHNKPLTVIAPPNAKYARVTVYPNNYTNWKDTVKFYDNNSFGIMPISGNLITSTDKKYGANLSIKLDVKSNLYFEGITFLSGDFSNTDELFEAGALSIRGTFESANTNSLWLNECKIFGGQVGGLDTNGYWNNSCDSVGGLLSRDISVYSFNCICAYNGSDALSYGQNPTYRNRIAFEYQNVIYDTLGGVNGSTANASTCHNYFNRISIGVIGINASGPVFADANGCNSIFINCHSKNAGIGVDNTTDRMALYYTDHPDANAEAWGRESFIILINSTAYGQAISSLNVVGNHIKVFVNNFKTNKKIVSDVEIERYEFD